MHLSKSSLATDRSRVKGLGAAKSGTEHFWRQRVTAVALIPLTLAFVVVLLMLNGADHKAATALLGNAFVGILMVCFIVAGCVHMRLGMQVIIEDYVHGEVPKLVLLMLNTFFSAVVGLASIYALLKISFGN